MSYRGFAARFGNMMGMCQEIGERNALDIERRANRGIFYTFHRKALSPRTAAMLSILEGETTNLLEIYLLAHALRGGPKLFEVDRVDFSVLTQTDVNIEIDDYAQPFDTVIIQLPEAFSRAKSIPCCEAGRKMFGIVMPEMTRPDFMILRADRECRCLLFGMWFETGLSMKGVVSIPPGRTIEDAIVEGYGPSYWDSLPTTEDEQGLFIDVLRASLNYCLLVDEVGTRCDGPANPSYKNRLERQARPGMKDPERAAAELRAHPTVYRIARPTQLFRAVGSRQELPSEPSGRRVGFHHRRGHYRMQPHGPGNSQRRRIRIQPTFVNVDLAMPGEFPGAHYVS